MTVQKNMAFLLQELQTVIQGLSLFTTLFDTSEEWLPDWLKVVNCGTLMKMEKIIYPSQLQDVPYKVCGRITYGVFPYWYRR